MNTVLKLCTSFVAVALLSACTLNIDFGPKKDDGMENDATVEGTDTSSTSSEAMEEVVSSSSEAMEDTSSSVASEAVEVDGEEADTEEDESGSELMEADLEVEGEVEVSSAASSEENQ